MIQNPICYHKLGHLSNKDQWPLNHCSFSQHLNNTRQEMGGDEILGLKFCHVDTSQSSW